MDEGDSRDVRYVIVEDDGRVTILEPLEDPDAHQTPEERQRLLDYLERMRQAHRRGSPPEAPKDEPKND
jgi:hypothetical protein